MRQKLRDAYPNRGELFDLKHDRGGMIDIEFIVQFLVLRDAAKHAPLTGSIGNIALLHLCGKLGLIDPALALQVADAYRDFRKLQHQSRLQGKEKAQVDKVQIENQINAVIQLWDSVFA